MKTFRHLRRHASAIRTLCDEAVAIDAVTTDPKEADCVRCLGEALVYHEHFARDVEERMKALAGTIKRCGVEGCRLPPDHRGRHAFGNNIP